MKSNEGARGWVLCSEKQYFKSANSEVETNQVIFSL